MSLKIDKVQLDIIINNDPARVQMRQLTDDLKAAQKELKKLPEGTKEWIAQSEKIKQIQTNIEGLKREIGLTGMTLNELTKHQKELNLVMRNMNPRLPEYKILQQELKETTHRISELRGNAKQAGGVLGGFSGDIKSMFAAFALGGIATSAIQSLFSGIKEFVNGSAEEFKKAEEAAFRLKQTILDFGGTEKQFEKLTEQATNLMGRFDDESIKHSQASLIQFGMSAEEVYNAMPALIDTAVARHMTLEEVVNKVQKGTLGQMRGLKELGIVLTDTGVPADNFAEIVNKLGKYHGFAGKEAETEAGQIEILKTEINEAQEEIGKSTIKLKVLWLEFQKGTISFFSDIGTAFKYVFNHTGYLADKMKGTLDDVKKDVSDTLSAIEAEAKAKGKTLQEFSKSLVSSYREDYIRAQAKFNQDNNSENAKQLAIAKQTYQEIFNATLIQKKAIKEQIDYKKLSLKELQEIAAGENKIESNLAEKEIKLREKNTNAVKEAKTAYEQLNAEIAKYEKLLNDQITAKSDMAPVTAQHLADLKAQKEVIDELNKVLSAPLTKIKSRKDGTDTSGDKHKAELDEIVRQNNLKLQVERDFQESRAELLKKYADYSSEEMKQEELKVLDSLKKDELLTVENYEQAKADIEEKYRKNKEKLDTNSFQIWLDENKKTIASVNAIQTASMNLISGLKDLALIKAETRYNAEIKAAGNNVEQKEKIEKNFNEEKKAIAKKYADFEMAIKISQIIASTAVSIMQCLAQLGPVAGAIAAILVGATGAVQIGVAIAERNQIAQAKEGKYPVIGADDGKTYDASVSNDMSTRITREPTLLVGEEAPELIVDGPTLKNLQMNYPEVLQAIQYARSPQYASGLYPQKETITNNNSQMFVDPEMLDSIKKLNGHLENGIKSYMVYSEYQKFITKTEETENNFNLGKP